MWKTRSGWQPERTVLAALLIGCALLGLAAPVKASGWTSPITVSEGASDARAPEIAFDSRGNALAVWYRAQPNGYPYRLDAAFRPAGGNFGPVQTVSGQDQDAFPGHNDLAFDTRGNAMVVWAAFSPDLGDLIWTAVRPSGGTFGTPRLLSGTGRNVEPRVAFDRRGNAIVIWARLGDSPYTPTGDIQTAFRATGTSFGTTQTLANKASDPTVAFDRKDNALALWAGGNVQGAFRPADGSFGATEEISNTAGSSAPQVSFDHYGNAVAIWSRFAGPYDRIQAALRPAGGRFESPANLSGDGPDFTFSPSLAADAKGNAIGAWLRYGIGDERIQVSFRPAGGSFGAPETIAEEPNVGFGSPALAMNQRGDTVLVWTRFTGVNSSIEAALRPAGGTFSAPEAISGGSNRGLDVAIDPKGNAVAVWATASGVEAAFNPSR